MSTEYKSVALLAADHPNLAEYLRQMERLLDDAMEFVRESVELWDNDGDMGFPQYDLGKRLLAEVDKKKQKE